MHQFGRATIVVALLLGLAMLGLTGCGADEDDGSSDSDAGMTDTGAGWDAGSDTGVATDTGATMDTGGSSDAGARDTGSQDTGAADTGAADTGPTDTGPTDTGPTDTGTADTGPEDTGVADTGPADTGTADTGSSASCGSGDGQCPAGCTVVTDSDCTLDCRDPSSWPQDWVDYEDEVLRLVNIERQGTANCGGTNYGPSPALTMNAQLREAARCHTLDMVTNNFMSHTGSNGSSMRDRIDATGYAWSYIAENVAAGYSTPAEVVAGWMTSDGHCKNIMNDRSEHIGVGYVFDLGGAARYDAYWTQNFGAPR